MKKTKRKQNNKQKKEKMSIKPNNLLFLCYLWWSICLIKFAKHQSCLLHLLSCYEAFKWSFSHSCIFQITQDICPQTSKIKRFLLSLRFNFSTSIYLKREICIVVVLQETGYKMVSLVFLQLLNNVRYLPWNFKKSRRHSKKFFHRSVPFSRFNISMSIQGISEIHYACCLLSVLANGVFCNLVAVK